MNWRIWFGLGLTFLWILLGAIYISANIGWREFTVLPADDMGNFLEGAFAPLAFLWLVIGYFLQQKELEQNTAALRAQAVEISRSAEQAVIQSKNLAATEIHARQEAFLQIAQSVRASGHGFLYRIMKVHQLNAPEAWSDHTKTGTHINFGIPVPTN